MDEFKSQMKNVFEMSDMGLLYYFLGLKSIKLKMEYFYHKGRDLLIKFGLLNCKPTTTPMNVGKKLKLNDRAEMDDARSFKSLVGGLIYLTHSCPNIGLSVGVISWFMEQPSKVHFGAAKRVLHYITGTMDYGI